MSHKSHTIMRHCMVVFAPYPLGETRVQREAEALVKHGYEVDVICIQRPGEAPISEYKGVRIYREKYRVPIAFIKARTISDEFLKYIHFFLTAGIRVTQLWIKKRYATIQVHNIPDFLVFCVLIPKLLGTPIVLDLHDLMPELYAGRFGREKSILMWLVRVQEKMACRFSDHVITVSEPWRQALIKRGVPESKCSVVMNVADEEIFHTTPNIHYQPPNGDSFRLIYHGSFVERNGLGLAIKAIGKVRDKIPGIHLKLVGRGEFLPHMINLIEELGLKDQITIDDLHVAEELPEIITACHLGIAPILSNAFTDSALPTKLMEYAALGLPAIAARTPINLTYFQDTNVEFFEPGSVDDLARCILFLYYNPIRMDELARGSKKFTQQYNWLKTSTEYVALVKRLGKINTALAD